MMRSVSAGSTTLNTPMRRVMWAMPCSSCSTPDCKSTLHAICFSIFTAVITTVTHTIVTIRMLEFIPSKYGQDSLSNYKT